MIFFTFSKRKSILVQKINLFINPIKKTLKRNYQTRLIERYHAVHDFLKLYEYVEEALEDISLWNDNDILVKARRLRSCILNEEFVFSLIILNKGFTSGKCFIMLGFIKVSSNKKYRS